MSLIPFRVASWMLPRIFSAVWSLRNKRRFIAFLQAAAETEEAASNSPADLVKELISMLQVPGLQDSVAELVESVMQSHSILGSACLGAIMGELRRASKETGIPDLKLGYERQLLLKSLVALIDDEILAFLELMRLWKSMSENNRIKLEVELNSLREELEQGHLEDAAKNKRMEELKRMQSDQHQSFSIQLSEEHLIGSRQLTSLGLAYSRLIVDRLVSCHAFSGDTGGYGLSGTAHGYFTATENSFRLYELISKVKTKGMYALS